MTAPRPLPIQQSLPLGKLVRPVVHRLAHEAIHPFVRLAHRPTGPLDIPPRIIFDHELVYLANGMCIVRFGDGPPITLESESLLLIRPFEPHQFETPRMAGPCTHTAVHFDLAPQTGARSKPYEVRLTGGLTLPRLTRWPQGTPIERLLDQLASAHRHDKPATRLQASALLMQVIAILLDHGSADQRANARTTPARRKVDRVVEHVRSHVADPLSATDLARIADMSEAHLTRLFRDIMGCSPMQYVRQTRIDRARQLLAAGELSVKQVARRVGFDDPYHFSRVFRQIDGLPPTAFRDAALAGSRTGA